MNGPAYGAGAEIALSSDMVIASTSSTFAFSGGRVGALCCISGVVGPLLMSARSVVEMNLTGEALPALEAQRLGLVNYAVPETELSAIVSRVLQDLRKVSPISNASFKRIRKGTIQKNQFVIAYRELLRTITSPDFKKGSKAFIAKTKPEYYT